MSSQVIIMPSGYEHSFILLASSVTMLHVGSGRSYGVVDLPIQRDPMGYPIIMASSFKGAFKSNLLAYSNVDKKVVETFLGSEPDKSISIPSLLLLTDLVPLAIPAPSASHGLVYVTTPFLLTKILNYIDVLKNTEPDNDMIQKLNIETIEYKTWETLINKLLENSIDLKNNEVNTVGKKFVDGDNLEIGTTIFKIKTPIPIDKNNYNKLVGIIKKLNKLYNYRHPLENLVIVSDDIGRNVIDKTILINYRIRIMRETKTVQRGALWSEEYLPYGTLFFSIILYKNIKKTYKRIHDSNKEEMFKKILNTYEEAWKKRGQIFEALRKFLIIGGKETIGKGIVKLDIHSIDMG